MNCACLILFLSISFFSSVNNRRCASKVTEKDDYDINPRGCEIGAYRHDDDESHPNETDIEGRIVGGEATTLAKFPFMVSITLTVSGRTSSCGGTLVNNRFVLTAAHCFVPQPTKIEVAVYNKGTSQQETSEIPWSQVKKHMRSAANDKHYDYALVKLNADCTNCVPVCMWTVGREFDQEFANPQPVSLTAVGWGRTSRNSDSAVGDRQSTTLRRVDLPYVPRRNCSRAYNLRMKSEWFCLGGEAGKDTCYGDSGGPAMYQLIDAWYQVGVVSGKPSNADGTQSSCGEAGKPGLYNRIYDQNKDYPNSIKWMKREMNNY